MHKNVFKKEIDVKWQKTVQIKYILEKCTIMNSIILRNEFLEKALKD